MNARWFVLGVMLALLVIPQTSGFAYSGDVTIKINGGNVAYIGELNKLELWITNDVSLGGMLLSFRTDWQVAPSWTKPYGNRPSAPGVQEYGNAVGAFDWDLRLDHYDDGVSPDSILLLAAAANKSLPAHAVSTKLYDFEFYIDPSQPEMADGLCIDNILRSQYNGWEFNDDQLLTSFAPAFQGNPNTDIATPDAPPVCFDVVQRHYVKGDADSSGSINISDAVYLIRFIFSGGPRPVPFAAGDVNCDQSVDISDVVYLLVWIFGGGPAPC